MLEKIELKEEYKVIDGKVYAFIKETNSKRQVDPCETRAELAQEILLLKQKKEALEAELADMAKKLTKVTILDNKIASLGYCRLDNPVYKKIDGIVIFDGNKKPQIERYTHQIDCKGRK